MQPITMAVLGAGDRGHKYGHYALAYPEDVRFVAVADPRPAYREDLAAAHHIPSTHQFETWQDLLAQPQMAEAVLVTLPDRLHYSAAIAALHKGYHVLLEKPMSPVPVENMRLVRTAQLTGRLLQICHVLRYSSFFQTVRQIVRSGRLGRVIHVQHSENVAYWHMAHSFVRGNWANSQQAGPMILTKCCHDFDILYWILGERVTHLSSVGALSHYTRDNQPDNAPNRCTDGCLVAEECKFDAIRFYVNDKRGWPFDVVALDPAQRRAALENGPYGRCVYACDNDVVDHQVVLMQTERDTTINLTMHGHAEEEHRSLRYEGTLATLSGRMAHSGYHLSLADHLTGNIQEIPVQSTYANVPHGGGDFGLMKAFVNAMRGLPDESLTTAEESLESHLLAFAAEEARQTRQVVNMRDFRETLARISMEPNGDGA